MRPPDLVDTLEQLIAAPEPTDVYAAVMHAITATTVVADFIYPLRLIDDALARPFLPDSVTEGYRDHYLYAAQDLIDRQVNGGRRFKLSALVHNYTWIAIETQAQWSIYCYGKFRALVNPDYSPALFFQMERDRLNLATDLAVLDCTGNPLFRGTIGKYLDHVQSKGN